ncbi:1,4-dihydroxy-2-naphthoate polyprenyltransferase [Simkania sp.]|uniref:1,4-dihydroxy-2-naphthoate polyprenyltransferase n=1 Tax=Simkania sp. TaxID=34094 RepID=UPI003B52EDEF
MNVWIEGARPKTLIASLSPILIGSVIAFKQGVFHPLIFLLTVLFGLSIQIGTNFANDYFDFRKGADTDDRKGPRRLTQSGLVSPETMKKVTAITFGFAAFIALYLIAQGGWVIGMLAALSIVLGYLYTGGPYPLAYLGLGDLFVLIFFGPVAVAGTVYLQTHELSGIAILAGLAPGLISTAILTSNNMRDINEDQAAGKRTLPVRFGLTFGRYEYIACLLIAGIIPIALVVMTGKHFGCLLASLALLPAMPLIKSAHRETKLEPLLPKTGKWMSLYTLAFLIGWFI